MPELIREVHELLEVEARNALDSGWAELTVEETAIGPLLRLEPIKMAAAPLEINFDSDELALCSPGRKGMSCEFFSEDPEEIKAKVRALAAAVVAGLYAERMRRGSSELVATWPGPDGKEEATREPLLVSAGGDWRDLAYEPY
jgi:hypothetical protein